LCREVINGEGAEGERQRGTANDSAVREGRSVVRGQKERFRFEAGSKISLGGTKTGDPQECETNLQPDSTEFS